MQNLQNYIVHSNDANGNKPIMEGDGNNFILVGGYGFGFCKGGGGDGPGGVLRLFYKIQLLVVDSHDNKLTANWIASGKSERESPAEYTKMGKGCLRKGWKSCADA